MYIEALYKGTLYTDTQPEMRTFFRIQNGVDPSSKIHGGLGVSLNDVP